ncbi:uncharacterized protein MYCFIDRAFT_82001 [Pseudocercospora fijiensis CIRAD86]|uniref:BTB domain-containing protein n=1 Tax=Pseudocercospora fijiensis (strain CIRAD86) TaxID=383855 RepID=M3B9P7_PSEFD|nr:uncharacterized protein MYCFIDRAFT_82001 [Pseudocercospora fijiensis CIRAD86]EME86052.1 hypothetical protein MYCFIDRAFT_82001 [Pseudocercospora fijiensis CIRAD86]
MASEHEKSFVAKIATLHLNRDYSDMKIICGTQEFPLHRAVVCPQSSVLADQMKSGFKESNGTIEHKEFDEDTVARMIQYLYTQRYDVPAYPVASESTAAEHEANADVESTVRNEGVELEPSVPSSSVESVALLQGPATNAAPEDVDATQFSSGSMSLQTSASLHDILMMHVRVHHIANYYDIPMLKIKAVQEFYSIVWSNNYVWERSGFASVLDEIYRANKSQDGGLRSAAARLAKKHVEDLAFDEAFTDAINDSENLGEFCAALLADMTRECRLNKKLGDKVAEMLRKEMGKLKDDLNRVQYMADREAGLRERAEKDLERVKDIFQKVRKCKTYSCENRINVAVERSGRAGQGEYMVRCLGCQAKHTPSDYR